MSNSAGSPSTLWRLRPAIYGAAQTQPRNINTTPKQLNKIGYRPRTKIGFWNVRTLLGTQTHQNSRFLQLEKLFSQYGLSILGVTETRRAAAFTKAQLQSPALFSRVSLRAQIELRDLLTNTLSASKLAACL